MKEIYTNRMIDPRESDQVRVRLCREDPRESALKPGSVIAARLFGQSGVEHAEGDEGTRD